MILLRRGGLAASPPSPVILKMRGNASFALSQREDDTVVAEWIYFLHPPRENFANTMTEAENEAWGRHFTRLEQMRDDGILILAGPTLGEINTGVTIFEAPNESAARRIVDEDPAIVGGFARGELRPFRVSLMRGRS
jgi:uncharacterized protein YciI